MVSATPFIVGALLLAASFWKKAVVVTRKLFAWVVYFSPTYWLAKQMTDTDKNSITRVGMTAFGILWIVVGIILLFLP